MPKAGSTDLQEWDVRVIAGAYSMESDGVVVELYGHTRDNRTITVCNHGFRPYFHLVDPPNSVLEELKSDPELVSIEPVELEVAGESRPCQKIIIQSPWKVPSYRGRYQAQHITVLAADIPFVHRFYYDKDFSACLTVKGKLREDLQNKFTTDLVVDAEKVKECKPFKPPLRIFSFDIENSLKDRRIFTICCAIRLNGPDSKIIYESLSGKERDIIDNFSKLVLKYDPDIITGYNIDGYDIPLLVERAKHLKMDPELKLGRDYDRLNHIGGRLWRLHGRIIADTWWNVKRELRPKKETLNAIAKLVLNEKKHDVDPKKIDSEWSKDPEAVIEYCKKDAELALRILEKIAVLEKYQDLATVAKLPLDEAINGNTSTLIDSILIRAADRNNIGVPCTQRISKAAKIEGGYVHTIKPGLYHWVGVLDFMAMYPTVIITNNICFTTLNPEGEIKSPVNVRFMAKKKRVGLLPQILEKLMEDRNEAKVHMKKSKDEATIAYYDGLQAAIKILMNAVYGVFASSFYRFTNLDIGESITAFARENIKSVIKRMGDEGITVIYSDTDSVFFQSPHEDLDKTVKFGNDLADRYSEGGAILEFEKVLNPFFTHGVKKRYVGEVIYPVTERLIRGYELRRTDSFDLQNEALTTLFDDILSDNMDNTVKTARDIIADVLAEKIPTDKLVISRTVKSEEYYKDASRMANVQAMRKLKELGYDFVPGMKVSYIVINSKKVPQEVEPYIDGRAFTAKPDYQYYAERMAASMARVTEVFGWNEKELLSGQQQRSLFSDWSENDKKPDEIDEEKHEADTPKKAGKKRGAEKKKKMKLEDFM
ncbi:MAG: DNA polymerase II [Thermoplasmata archaeon]|nr:MAG: DNA polymerase II [Thermoplasmata archaeon]